MSLKCICSKVIEYVICKRIIKHTEKHSIPTVLQHGFGRAISCESQSISCESQSAGHHQRYAQLVEQEHPVICNCAGLQRGI